MEWIEIDKNSLPDDEVLAANFQKRTQGYKEKLIGYLHKENNSFGEVVQCEDEHQVLTHFTHYIPIHEFDVK